MKAVVSYLLIDSVLQKEITKPYICTKLKIKTVLELSSFVVQNKYCISLNLSLFSHFLSFPGVKLSHLKRNPAYSIESIHFSAS